MTPMTRWEKLKTLSQIWSAAIYVVYVDRSGSTEDHSAEFRDRMAFIRQAIMIKLNVLRAWPFGIFVGDLVFFNHETPMRYTSPERWTSAGMALFVFKRPLPPCGGGSGLEGIISHYETYRSPTLKTRGTILTDGMLFGRGSQDKTLQYLSVKY